MGLESPNFGKIYKLYFPTIKRYILKNSGTEADAEDIFQDAMVVILEKYMLDDFKLTATLKTYIYAVSKNLWLKKLRHKKREQSELSLENQKFYEEIQLSIENELSIMDKAMRLMNLVSKHCHRLLSDVFFNGKEIDEIREEYGYTTKHNATNQKYKCLSQARKLAKVD